METKEDAPKRFIRAGVKRFSSRAEVVDAICHNQRKFDRERIDEKTGEITLIQVRHIDPDRKGLNIYEEPWRDALAVEFPEEPIDEWTTTKAFDAMIGTCVTGDRKVKYIAVEVVISPSNGALYSSTDSTEKRKEINRLFFDDCKKYCLDRFHGRNILSIDLHGDETTPHFHCLFVPRVEHRYSSKTRGKRYTALRNKTHRLSFTAHLGREKQIGEDADDTGFRGLHSDVANRVGKKWNLIRGAKFNGNKNIPNKEFRKIVEHALSKVSELKEPPMIFAERYLWWQEIKEQYTKLLIQNEHLKKSLATTQSANRRQTLFSDRKDQEIELLQKENTDLKTQLKDKLRGMSLSSVMSYLGYLKKDGPRPDSKPGSYFRIPEGNLCIDKENQRFELLDAELNTRIPGFYGKGAINLLMKVEFSKSPNAYEKSVGFLSAILGDKPLLKEERIIHTEESPLPEPTPYKDILKRYVNRDQKMFSVKRDILVSRGIDGDLIDRLYKNNRISINDRGDLVFLYSNKNSVTIRVVVCDIEGHFMLWLDNDKINRFASSEARFVISASEHSKRLTIVNHPLDALALASIYPDETIAAVCSEEKDVVIPDVFLDDCVNKYQECVFAYGKKDEDFWAKLQSYNHQIPIKIGLKSKPPKIKRWFDLNPIELTRIWMGVWERKLRDSLPYRRSPSSFSIGNQKHELRQDDSLRYNRDMGNSVDFPDIG